MRIIFEAQALTMYSLAKPGFKGGTEQYVNIVAAGLAAKGHEVHVVAADADRDEQRAPTLWYWPPAYHPTQADALVAVHSLAHASPDAGYDAPLLVAMSNGLGADYGPENAWAQHVDLFPVFSKCHADLLSASLGIDPAKCRVTGLGVDLDKYPKVVLPEADLVQDADGVCYEWPQPNIPGRIFVANDPARGLWHVLDVFEKVVAAYPAASLHVGYDAQRHIEARRWHSTAQAEVLLDCRRRMRAIPNVVDLGALTPEQVVYEQMSAQVHLWPSDPPNVGSQIHGITQLECAAAGCALVLSETEAFPELFGAAAKILPLPGRYIPEIERRIDAADWATAVLALMRDERTWTAASRMARKIAERHTWDRVVRKWDAMLTAAAAAPAAPR